LAATIVNEGNLIQPSIVNQITGAAGEIIYQNHAPAMKRVILPSTSRVLYDLMEATVRYGTSRKAFRGYQKDEVLSKLNIGGKTGSIYNRSHEVKYDWFVGFADLKNGNQKLALAVVVAHEKYIGIRAGKYAYLVMKKYFADLI
jgi:cell division protein FtsI/penicillin-binding protein 2